MNFDYRVHGCSCFCDHWRSHEGLHTSVVVEQELAPWAALASADTCTTQKQHLHCVGFLADVQARRCRRGEKTSASYMLAPAGVPEPEAGVEEQRSYCWLERRKSSQAAEEGWRRLVD